jgi:NADH dehydrogenase FAD-containing subunit
MGVAVNLPPKEAVAKLHTVIVGGGPSGVELAGDLTHYLRELAKSFNVDPSLITIDLIESAPRILAALPEKVSQKAEKRLRMLGVNIYPNRAVTGQNINEVLVGGMNFETTTVIWTAGTRINSVYRSLPNLTFDERGRVEVNEFLALPKDNNIFVIGDGAATKYSGLAQTANHNGSYLGKSLAKRIQGRTPEPYVPHPVSFVIPIGNFWALFVHGRAVWKGFLPWILRSAVDFRYFTSVVPFWYVLDVFRQGHKYRRSKTYCPIE